MRIYMNWKICLGVILTFTIIAIPLGIMFIIFGLLDMRKNSKNMTKDKSVTYKVNEWEEKTFINSYNSKDKYEQRYL